MTFWYTKVTSSDCDHGDVKSQEWPHGEFSQERPFWRTKVASDLMSWESSITSCKLTSGVRDDLYVNSDDTLLALGEGVRNEVAITQGHGFVF